MIRTFYDVYRQGVRCVASTSEIFIKDCWSFDLVIKTNVNLILLNSDFKSLAVDELFTDGDDIYPYFPWDFRQSVSRANEKKVRDNLEANPFWIPCWYESKFNRAAQAYRQLSELVETIEHSCRLQCFDGPYAGSILTVRKGEYRVDFAGEIYEACNGVLTHVGPVRWKYGEEV